MRKGIIIDRESYNSFMVKVEEVSTIKWDPQGDKPNQINSPNSGKFLIWIDNNTRVLSGKKIHDVLGKVEIITEYRFFELCRKIKPKMQMLTKANLEKEYFRESRNKAESFMEFLTRFE